MINTALLGFEITEIKKIIYVDYFATLQEFMDVETISQFCSGTIKIRNSSVVLRFRNK